MRSLFFCVYDEPSTDFCLHKNLYLENVMVTEQTATLFDNKGRNGI